MGTLKNISGEPLDVPRLRRTVADGEEIEVPDSLLTNADLVWPAGVWEVNGGSHEHDPNSPENTAKREGAERLTAQEAERTAAEAQAAQAEATPEPVTASAVDSPVRLTTDVPATETEES